MASLLSDAKAQSLLRKHGLASSGAQAKALTPAPVGLFTRQAGRQGFGISPEIMRTLPVGSLVEMPDNHGLLLWGGDGEFAVLPRSKTAPFDMEASTTSADGVRTSTRFVSPAGGPAVELKQGEGR